MERFLFNAIRLPVGAAHPDVDIDRDGDEASVRKYVDDLDPPTSKP